MVLMVQRFSKLASPSTMQSSAYWSRETKTSMPMVTPQIKPLITTLLNKSDSPSTNYLQMTNLIKDQWCWEPQPKPLPRNWNENNYTWKQSKKLGILRFHFTSTFFRSHKVVSNRFQTIENKLQLKTVGWKLFFYRQKFTMIEIIKYFMETSTCLRINQVEKN